MARILVRKSDKGKHKKGDVIAVIDDDRVITQNELAACFVVELPNVAGVDLFKYKNEIDEDGNPGRKYRVKANKLTKSLTKFDDDDASLQQKLFDVIK